jgi:hypothetical protein
MNELYSEHENSLRRFLVNEILKKVEVNRDLTKRTRLATDPSAIADAQLARHFSKMTPALPANQLK